MICTLMFTWILEDLYWDYEKSGFSWRLKRDRIWKVLVQIHMSFAFNILSRGNFSGEEIVYTMFGEEIDITFLINTLASGSSKISEV